MSRATTRTTVGDRITSALDRLSPHRRGRANSSRASSRRSSSRRSRSCSRCPGARSAGATRAPHHSPAARLEAAARQDLRHARRRPLAAGARPQAPRARRGRLPRGRDQCAGLRPAGRGQEPRDVCRGPCPRRPRPLRALHADLQPRAGAARREARSRACPAPSANSITSPSCCSMTSGYIQQSPEEAEVLFTLLAERYERRSVCITSNLVFGQWDRIFRDQMATAAAIDRLVHHSVILEFDVPELSHRAGETPRKTRRPSRRDRRPPDAPNRRSPGGDLAS